MLNKKVLRNLSYGVYLVTTMDNERPTGCTANSAMQITSEPSTIAISINHDNFTNSCIKKHKRFALTILSENSPASLIGTFGFQSGKDTDKFNGISYEMIENVPVIKEGCGYFVCEVTGEYETSTHTVFFADIIEGEPLEGTPMTYSYYHNVVKGKSPKNAPTYQKEEENEKKEVWKCGICGYEYDGDVPFESLPDDYKCPICKQPKSVFKKV